MDQIYNSIIEALIFASDEPITASEIVKAIKSTDGKDTQITTGNIDKVVDELNELYQAEDKAFSIKSIAEGFTFCTKPEYAKYIGYITVERSKRRLSQAAVETLSIIAYKQPLTKPELESIRGVNSDYIISTLLEKNLITIKGRAETIGRPILYGTTDEFLMYFGLNKITDLPKPREIDEIMKDEDFLEQKRQIMMNEVEQVIEDEVNNSEDRSESTIE
ncbi:MAG: SMC-Scp complex subunit ScpB [Melioribacteraceae bacterium]|nr:SMC-Scp complex subunit ScpB [Melioribacteraceae bacterium]